MPIRTALIAALLAATSTTAMAADIKEGRWGYTMTMDMPDMPAMPKIDPSKLPPGMNLPQFGAQGMTMHFERCVTERDAVPSDNQGATQCTTTKMDRHGSTVDWESTCRTPHGTMHATGTATYSGETMHSTTHMTGTDSRGKPIDMTQTIDGRYLGACRP